ncbi:MAG: XRE family transcriptional regulator [Actinomycetota bacterium]|nr:XRE family transcriptional regulator [Actinomycetota bacterium]
MINGERVRQAREMRALTQTALAERVGMSQPYIAQVESGYLQPSKEVLEAVALQTGFPPAFFRQESTTNFPEGSLLFRARRSITATQRAQAHQYAKTIFEGVERMAEKLEVVPVRLPRGLEDPRAAAQDARAALGLPPDTPIRHLINTVEKGGVLVLALPVALEKRDAYSLWAGHRGQKPVIVVAGEAPGDRLRFSVAHELGHLILHREHPKTEKEMDDEADRFASEFLLPEEPMRHELVTPITLTGLAQLKLRWRVSIQALIRRARDLDIITERQYKYLFQKLSKLGWRKQEPKNFAVPVEKPRAVRQMAELLYGKPIDSRRLADDAKLTEQFVREVIDAYQGAGKPKSTDARSTRAQVVSLKGRSEGHRNALGADRRGDTW